MNRNKNESGRSMVEMLGVLAIIGVLSVGGIAGYKAATEKIMVNKVSNIIQRYSLSIDEAENEDSPLNNICAMGNDDYDCKKEKYAVLCARYFGDAYCSKFDLHAWGMYTIPGTESYWGAHFYQAYLAIDHDEEYYRTLLFIDLPDSVCEKLIPTLSQYERVVGVMPYCGSHCQRRNITLKNFDDAAQNKLLCQGRDGGTKSANLQVIFQ